MRILIVTQYFWPENFKINDLALELKLQGNEVTVLTGQPNYPEGKFFSGYSFRKPKREEWNGVEIKRVPLFPRRNSKGINLIVNYISFVFFGILLSLNRLKGNKFDLIFVFEISPITVGLPAIWLKRRFKIPIYFWVLDLWPETLYALGVVKSRFFKVFVERLVNYIYRNCDFLLISSKSFEKSLVAHGVPSQKISYFPNWAEDIFSGKGKPETIEEFSSLFNLLSGKFRIMFAGNLGESQDVETILKAAVELKTRKDIVWLFVGDGRSRGVIETTIQQHQLSETVLLLGKHPLESMPFFFSNADVMLVSLKADPVFSLTVPAKIQTYMASKKPILAMVSGEGNAIVKEASCGLTCESGDYLGLSENVATMS